MVAFDQVFPLFLTFSVNDLEADTDCDHRKRSKQKIWKEQHLWLLVEQLFVVKEFSDVYRG